MVVFGGMCSYAISTKYRVLAQTISSMELFYLVYWMQQYFGLQYVEGILWWIVDHLDSTHRQLCFVFSYCIPVINKQIPQQVDILYWNYAIPFFIEIKAIKEQ